MVSTICARKASHPSLIHWNTQVIIAAQEIAHSLETEKDVPPRMICKIDIEKAFDNVEWPAIIATLQRMLFPENWITWISSYLNSASFSFLVNGHPTSWILSSRGVRQGDPISPLLFILVSQNLSAILNRALQLDMIHGFNQNLSKNFNHLLFADDLILITKATRRNARNCLLCLNVYQNLTGQKQNLSKSALYVRSWQMLYQKSLALNWRVIHSWNHSSLSMAGKITLLNSTVFAIPNYILSVMNLPISILDCISKLARCFLWGRSSNNQDFHSIGWSITTLCKSNGGLGIHNLRLVNHSLMTKNLLAILNSEDKIWVHIFKNKYRGWCLWDPDFFPDSSWFYKSICNTTNVVRSNFKLFSCDPDLVDIWKDACIFDLPISRKPTFLNTSMDLDELKFSYLISSNGFCSAIVNDLFGNSFDINCINDTNFNNDGTLVWKWNQLSCNVSVASTVYNNLNRNPCSTDPWIGWCEIWRLPVIPRIKVHIWKLAHGKLPTYSYLYNLNIGPNNPCPLCGLEPETTAHLFWEYALLSSNSGSIVIFTDASWSADTSVAGLGFLILTNSMRILATGSWGTTSSSPVQAEIAAINFAFHTCNENGWMPNLVFCDCPGVAQLLKHYNASIAWHITTEFHCMRRNLVLFPNTSIHTISKDLNSFADSLANFGKSNPQLQVCVCGTSPYA
ncbi:uncharacterized protein LOC120253920 [Dioscorea cayenensis subsp. rotundata]|uniref:Uncharacterized protein LOC120253920 n=1 Tax=Dioscorea cayennensis subsp. rotundata TaxID=55577 RepID=A0AB40ATU8_DIOCR|nr:uncharacterized protein LOC120253920 [Dioscorea cayenensis subsp. rotundata]